MSRRDGRPTVSDAARARSLEEHLRAALARVDVIVSSGGVSMGELDLLKPTIERSLGGTIHFGRVDMKPGKPSTFATIPLKDARTGRRHEKLIFSLPGNPASALVALHLFVLPSLHRSCHPPAPDVSCDPFLRTIRVLLGHAIRPDTQRPEYHRAVLSPGRSAQVSGEAQDEGGQGQRWHEDERLLYAHSTGGQRSSRIGSLKSANALLVLPAGKDVLPKGTVVAAILMGGKL